MRPIGHLPDESQARRFGDHLLASGIRSEIEADAGSGWEVWVIEDDHIAAAQAELERFRANPDAAEFRNVRSAAERVRDAQAKDLEDYRKRVRTAKSLFPRFGGYGIRPLTFSLILLCVSVAFFTKLGYNRDAVEPLLLADPANANGTILPEVRDGQVWRLISPSFIHFGPVHLIFNMIWLFQLGCMIEARRGTLQMALLVVVTGVLPMLAQYAVSGPGYVGGMSGVVYGLAGYVWMRGKYDPASGVFLDRQSVQWLLIWLVVCYVGVVGRVANTAHLAGLITGMAWGRVSAFIATRRPE